MSSTNVTPTILSGTKVTVSPSGEVGVNVTPLGPVNVNAVVGAIAGLGIIELVGPVTAGPGSGVVVTSITDGAVTNDKLADMAQSTIKGRAAGAGTGVPTDLTATQATAILNAMVGDSGAGVTKGLVPAAATGSASTAFLRKDGTWAIPGGVVTGDMTKAVYDPQNASHISGATGAGAAVGGTLNMDAGSGATGTGGSINTTGGATTAAGGAITTSGALGKAGGSINTSGGVGGIGGSINTSGGSTGAGGSISTNGNATNPGGSLSATASTASGATAGSLSMNGGAGLNSSAGSINTNGGTASSSPGGSITTSGSGGFAGGAINTSGSSAAGGAITTSNGGGAINTAGVGSIGMGVAATRTTVVGTATAARSQSLPDSDGMHIVTTGGGSYLSGLVITSDGSDPTNDLDITTGVASDSANALILNLSSALIKQQDAVWAVGTNAGGMYQSAALAGTISTSGSSVTVTGVSTAFLTDFVVGDVITDTTGAQSRRIATITNNTSLTVESVWTVASSSGYKRGGKAKNTRYYVYVIRRSGTGVVDVFFTTRDPSQTVTLPTSYDSSRLIGGFNNNGTPAVDGVFNTNGFQASGFQTIDYVNTLATNVDTGLFFYIAANEQWMVEFHTSSTAGAAGGKVQITAPTSATTEAFAKTIDTSGGVSCQEITAINTLTGAALRTGASMGDTAGKIDNSTTAGALALGAASVTGTQTTTIKAKSYFTARRR